MVLACGVGRRVCRAHVRERCPDVEFDTVDPAVFELPDAVKAMVKKP